jgi:hypothetical protein
MQTEKDILYKMRCLVSDFMIMIYQSKIDLSIINNDINCLDNTYFYEHPEILKRLNSIFNQKELQELSFLLQDFKGYVDFKLDTLCEHEWIDDEIDITPDRSQKIIYCKICQTTKR